MKAYQENMLDQGLVDMPVYDPTVIDIITEATDERFEGVFNDLFIHNPMESNAQVGSIVPTRELPHIESSRLRHIISKNAYIRSHRERERFIEWILELQGVEKKKVRVGKNRIVMAFLGVQEKHNHGYSGSVIRTKTLELIQ